MNKLTKKELIGKCKEFYTLKDITKKKKEELIKLLEENTTKFILFNYIINKEDKGFQLIFNSQKQINLIDSNTLWSILDILRYEIDYNINGDGNGFYNNRELLIDGFKENKLYMLNYVETTEIYNNLNKIKQYKLPNTFDSLPCFCLLDKNNEIDIIWTHIPFRKLGFAKCFINHFYSNKEKHINYIISDAKDFWEHMEFKYDRIIN